MNDDLTVILIESINANPNIDATKKIELVEYTIRNCKEKKIGKIIMDAVKSKRGRPKGVKNKRKEILPRTENQMKMIQIAKENTSF